MLSLDSCKKYSPAVLRIGISLVFLWFGVNQLIINPESFIGYLPTFLQDHPDGIPHEHPLQFAHSLPLAAHLIISLNGLFEIIFGTLLLLGFFVRISAGLLAVHLFFIALSLGYNDVAVRDFGLLAATIAVFLNGDDEFAFRRK